MENKLITQINDALKHFVSFRLLAFLLCYFSASLSFSASSQVNKITIKLKNKPLSEVLNQIEIQSGFSFLVRSNDVNLKEVVSIDAENKSIEEVLNQLFKQRQITYEISGKNISIFKPQKTPKNAKASGESTKITGLVSDQKGEPMIGAIVMVKGSKTRTVTDANGNFSLDADDQSTLIVSYIGYYPYELKVDSHNNLKINLEENSQNLDEVIVMGYSSQKKSELSSSAVTLTADKLTDVTTSDIGNMLEGKVAGVSVSNATGQPGSAAEIRIRGTGSITAAADPLYVVDGIPGGSFNPNDVQTITVLKDAGATALYGSAASGGVIVVTTKTASLNQPTKIDVKATVGSKSALFGHFVMMDTQELYDEQKQLFSPALFSILRPSSILHTNFNWQNAFFKTGLVNDDYVSASASNGKTSYFTSLDYYKEAGTLINTGYTKVSGRINLNSKLYKNLDMNVRLAYTNSDIQEASSWTTLNDAYTKMPWDTPYDKSGNLEKITSSTRTDGSTWYSQDKWNALQNEEYNYNKTHSYDLVADFQMNWSILDWLVFTTTNRYDQNTSKNVMYIDPRTFSPQYANGYLSNTIYMGNSFGTTNILKSDNKIGNHSINTLLGWEWGQSNVDYTSAAGQGMPAGTDALNASSVYSIGGNSIPIRTYSGFGQIQYSYDSKYFATASLRADESSKFAPKKRLGWFPSGAASWLISKEDFLKDSKIITFLKLRASYGVTGNSNIGDYEYLSSYTLSSSYQGVVAAIPSKLSNPYLGWETAYMTNVGVDINLGKKIQLNIDLYNTDNKDLLLRVPLSPTTGFFDVLKNAGSVRNRGIEFGLNTTNISTKNFKWEMSFNIGFNKNVVTETPQDQAFLQTRSGISQQVKRGQDIYSWFMPKWLGVDPANGNPVWEKIEYDTKGNITGRVKTSDYKQATFQVVGKATPLFTGGWSNNFTYHGFNLRVTTNFVYGNKIFNYNRLALDADGAYLGYNQMSLNNGLGWTRWQKAGDIATDPKLVMNGNLSSNSTSSRYLEDGSFFRIKNLQLGYELPYKLVRSAHIQRCKIYVSADNLFTFDKFSGMDPEVSSKTTDYVLAGFYTNNYPSSKQIMLGLEIGF